MLKKLIAGVSLILIMTPNAFSAVKIKSSFIVDMNKTRGTESAKDLVKRLRKDLNTNFSKNKNDFTFNYFERYFQLYSNEPKGIFGKPVFLSAKYNAEEKVTYADVEVHFYKKNEKDIGSTVVNSKVKIVKPTDPNRVAFEFKSDYGWGAQQLIKLYLSFGDGSRLIQDFISITVIYDQKYPNQLKIDVDLIAYGRYVQQKIIDKEVNFSKKVATNFLAELRL